MKSKQFPLFSEYSRFTDDTILTVAVANVVINGGSYVDAFHDYFHRYPQFGFGGAFIEWALQRSRKPYNSWGNGAAMRVAPIGFAHDDLEIALAEAKRSAEVTHNHVEAIRGAQSVVAAIVLARQGKPKLDIKQTIQSMFGYDLNIALDDIRQNYKFDTSCQGSVPQSIVAFLEANDYEDAVRNAVSLGGDADTMACIAGGIAEAFYGPLPDPIVYEVRQRLNEHLLSGVDAFLATH